MAISNSDDILDVRDIIERYEELETELTDAHEADSGDAAFAEWLKATADSGEYGAEANLCDEASEFTKLGALLGELKGTGGDHQWKGVWYPASLIRESYFETAMNDMLEDIGDMPKNIPPYLKITVDYDALKMDYTSVDFDDEEYWYR